MKENQIVIYQTEDGQTQIDVRLENETVWLTQAQMGQLFQTDRTSIVRHINNIYKVEELDRDSTCAEIAQVQIEGKRTIKRNISYFNLDMIISVGYRVNSKRGVRFRQWANKVLKDYLVKGFAVNERIRKEQIGELRQLVGMLGRTIQSQPLLSTDETNALFEVVTDYTYALDTLDNYDYERLTIERPQRKSPSTQHTRTQCRRLTAFARSLAAPYSLVTRRTTPSRAASDRFIRPLAVKNSIQAWRRKLPCCYISSRKTIPSATATNALLRPCSYGSSTTIVFCIAKTAQNVSPTTLS